MVRSLFDVAFNHREDCPNCKPALCPEGRALFKAAHDKCVQFAALSTEPPAVKA